MVSAFSWALPAVLALTMMPAAVAQETAPTGQQGVRLVEPRAFGYFVGDVIARRIEIVAQEGEKLDPASLPQPGLLNYWLEVKSIEHGSKSTKNGSIEALNITYQSFYTPLDPRFVAIPQATVRLRKGEASRDVVIPPFRFVMSPIREIFPEKENPAQGVLLRPDAKPSHVPTSAKRNWLLVSAALSLAMLALLARHWGWWPFTRRPARPFTRAERAVRSSAYGFESLEYYRSALLALHRAFDEAKRNALLAGDVDMFLLEHSEHVASRESIQRFFDASRVAFFGEDWERARKLAPPGMLRELASALAVEERSVR